MRFIPGNSINDISLDKPIGICFKQSTQQILPLKGAVFVGCQASLLDISKCLRLATNLASRYVFRAKINMNNCSMWTACCLRHVIFIARPCGRQSLWTLRFKLTSPWIWILGAPSPDWPRFRHTSYRDVKLLTVSCQECWQPQSLEQQIRNCQLQDKSRILLSIQTELRYKVKHGETQ